MADPAPSAEPTGLARHLPILTWLPRYDRSWLRGDVIAGLSVWALMVPTSLGYATISGVLAATVGTAKVRLLLPPEHETRTDETFPVLYLLHGGGGGYIDWTKNTDVETHTAATDVIVAMPDALSSRLDTWLSEGGPPNWEHFHVNELPELLERNWRAGENRAVGGLSLGGYTAMMYAGREPDLYQAVSSCSGALGLALLQDAPKEARELVEQATALAEAAGWDDAEPVDLLPSILRTKRSDGRGRAVAQGTMPRV